MMGDHTKRLERLVSKLLDSQKLAVLSTSVDNQPYSSLVAFSTSPDLKRLFFATPQTTRKFHHLTENPKVSLLVNSAMNRAEDIHEAAAVTILGDIEKSTPEEAKKYRINYLSKHPHMKEFVHAKTTALVCVRVRAYYYVERFQQVMELRVT